MKINKWYLVIFFIAECLLLSAQEITVDQYINKYKDLAIQEMRIYRIPASIILAQGIEESGNGNSELARKANNHFGVKCQDNWTGETIHKDDETKNECFRKYKTVEESFNDHCEFIKNRTRYSFLFDYKSNDYQSWAKGLKTAGYATNPKYPEKLINNIEKYKLDKFDFDVDKPQFDEKAILSRERVLKTQHIEHSQSDAGKAKSTREIIMKNGIKAIIAKKSDNYENLATELDMFKLQILSYNDLKQNDSITEGEIIYLQPKHRKGSADFHLYRAGEDMRIISQQYGIKLKRLLKLNKMETGSVPVPGQKLYLRKKS
jgi:hypothetical protein